ncbi:MAG TPA: glycine cleavage system protein GcvH [Methanomassiliicoccales archaeon]|nr:glycine cleavage system protein GcvH [Methanomassiliicoccales archaeon]
MSEVPEGLHYTKDHEWTKVEGDVATVGITDHAQEELTEFVYVQLPKKGVQVKKGDVLAIVESVKNTADVYAPVSGEVVDVNAPVDDDPALINGSPYENGWLAKIKMSDPSEPGKLMDAAAYRQHIGE